MTTNVEYDKRTVSLPFTLSLLAGIFILLTSSITWMWSYPHTTFYGYGGFMGMGSMMQGWMAPISIIGIVSGIVIVISAVMIYKEPKEGGIWGTLVIAFSVVALFGMGGGFAFIGTIVGIIGGILAISRR
jgi:hypothetical protein